MKNAHNSMFDKDHFYYNWSVLYQTAIAIYLHMLHGLWKLTHVILSYSIKYVL